MAKMKLKDANGKEFEVDIKDFTDIETSPGFELNDGEGISSVEIMFTDSLGNKIDVTNFTDSESLDNIAALDVAFESTHSGKNKNYVTYHSDSMEKDAQTFLMPFAKPLIKNHDMYSEPLGRVKDTMFKQSALNPNRDTIEVTFRVTDSESIPKFLDGRYKTMSIGAKGNHIKCETCGKDIVKDGKFIKFCGHWKGEQYNNETCYWTVRDMEYKEGSVVNSPADSWAQIVSIKVITKDQMKQGEDSNKEDGSEEMSKSKSTDASVETNVTDAGDTTSIIDGILDEGTESEGSVEDNKDSGTGDVADGDNPEDASNTKDGEEETVVQEDEDLTVKITSLQEEKVTLTDKIEKLENELAELSQKIKDSDSKASELTATNELLEGQIDSLRTQSVKLAVRIKDELVTKVINYRLSKGELKQEDADSARQDLKAKKASELEQIVKDFDNKQTTQTVVAIENPGLVDSKDPNAIVDDSEGEVDKSKDTKKKHKTLEDMQNILIDRLCM